MRVRIRVLALSALPLVGASLQAAEAEPTAAQYEALVERYAHGDRDDPFAEMVRWSPDALSRAARSERGDQDALFRTAEIVLQTDVALARLPDEGPDGFGKRVGGIRDLDRAGLDPHFRARWHLAIGAVYLQISDAETARRYLRRGHDIVWDDPLVLVALGASFEQQASLPFAGSGYLIEHMPNPDLVRRQLLSQAVDYYRQALEADPECADAHLWLAWTDVYEGHPERGAEQVAWVRKHAEAPDLLYVADLLAGRALERQGALEQAVARYRQASVADPRGSIAQLAASEVLKSMGDDAGAGQALLRALHARRNGTYVDAWQGHYLGRPAWLQIAIEDMARALVEQP